MNESGVSAVRQYLEDNVRFAWKDGNTECRFPNNKAAPLIFKRSLDLLGKSPYAFIDEFSLHESYKKFAYAFAVKQIVDGRHLGKPSRVQTEVKELCDLRHPHICVFLGTFMHRDRLHILTYPAAAADLGDLLENVSKHCTKEPRSSLGPNLPTTKPKYRDLPHECRLAHISAKDKLLTIKGYFACLCQALNYLHEVEVRHMNIKPENILLDNNGSVILTDFGISAKLGKNKPRVTSDGEAFTERYISPETAQGRSRDNSDDVFMLGCVFLEMASIVLGYSWQRVRDHFSKVVNVDGVVEDFCSNLAKLSDWCLELQSSHDSQILTKEEVAPIIGSLGVIRQMMSERPYERPKSEDLWENFDFEDIPLCRDCHPRHHEAYYPSPSQYEDSLAGIERRQPLTYAIHGLNSDSYDIGEVTDGYDTDPSNSTYSDGPGPSSLSPHTVQPADIPIIDVERPYQMRLRRSHSQPGSSRLSIPTIRRSRSVNNLAQYMDNSQLERSQDRPLQHVDVRAVSFNANNSFHEQAEDQSSTTSKKSPIASYVMNNTKNDHFMAQRSTAQPIVMQRLGPRIVTEQLISKGRVDLDLGGATKAEAPGRLLRPAQELLIERQNIGSASSTAPGSRLSNRNIGNPQRLNTVSPDMPQLGLEFLTSDLESLGLKGNDKLIRYNARKNKIDEQSKWSLEGLQPSLSKA